MSGVLLVLNRACFVKSLCAWRAVVLLLISTAALSLAVSCSPQGTGLGNGESLYLALINDDVATVSDMVGQIDPADLDSEFFDGRTLLAVAVECDSPQSVSVILNAGASPLVESASSIYIMGGRKLPIEIAARYPLEDVLIELVEHESSELYTDLDRESIRSILESGEDEWLSKNLIDKLELHGFFN